MKPRIIIFILSFLLTSLGSFAAWHCISFNPNLDVNKSRKKVEKALEKGDSVRFIKLEDDISLIIWRDSAYLKITKHLVSADSIFHCNGFKPRRLTSTTVYRRKEISNSIWELTLNEDPSKHFFLNAAMKKDTTKISARKDSLQLTILSPKIDIPVRYLIELDDNSLYSTDFKSDTHSIRLPRRDIRIRKIYAFPYGVFSDCIGIYSNMNPNPLCMEVNYSLSDDSVLTLPNAENEDLIKSSIDKITLIFSGFWMESSISTEPFFPIFW